MATKYTFIHIGKANDRIAELEALVADRDTALAAAQTRIAELEAAPKPDANTEQLQADLATAKTTIGTLEASVKAKDAELANAKADAEKAKTDASHQASLQAHQITASQGQPPLTITPSEKPGKTVTTSNLTGLERAIAAHKADYAKTEISK